MSTSSDQPSDAPTTEESPPARLSDVRIHPNEKAAGGWGAIRSTLRHASAKTGLMRGVGILWRINQPGGFDCPSCAWPDPHHRGRLEFCENGAKAATHEATRHLVTPTFFAEHEVESLYGRSDLWLERQGRITHPMVRRAGATHYEPIGWDEAFALIGAELRALGSPDEAVFYTSGRTSNEAAFLYQLFVRRFGTNNLPDCSNMCHESSGRGLGEVLGVGKGTVSLDDFDHADLIFIIGQNPGTNHPRMLTTLQSAAKRGCRIVSINPLREAGLVRFAHPKHPLAVLRGGSEVADVFLQVRVNGDVAALKGICKAVLEREGDNTGSVLDHAFIHDHTSGFEALRRDLERTTWDEIVDASGLSVEAIREVAEIYARSERTIACWAMGLTQHKNGVANVQAVVNLLLLRGNIGRQGAGVCPVRGHSNVQGDRTMGIWEAPKPEFLDRLGEAYRFAPPRTHGFHTVSAIEAMTEGRARVFFALGGNFVAASPDTAYTEAALRRCRLTVQVSTTLNRSHLVTGEVALILPCLSRSEADERDGVRRFVTVENSMSVVHTSRGHLAPASEHLRSEPEIVAGVAAATLGEHAGVDASTPTWRALGEDYDRVRDGIAQVVSGFEDFNRRIREPGWFVLPNGARERTFDTSTGKARFTVHPIPRWELADGELLMMTIRSHDQFNTTIYGDDDRYRGIYGARRVVMLNEDDMRRLGVFEGQLVDLVSHFEGQRRRAPGFVALPYDIPRGSAATYFPEANSLVPVGAYADKSHTPASKSVVITVEPASDPAAS
jgi:molybdopterin-dependent oxidoreductase alpha subunit